jgi:hypothetical protein
MQVWADLEGTVRVDVSAEAGEFVRGRGGRLWVWAALGRLLLRPVIRGYPGATATASISTSWSG